MTAAERSVSVVIAARNVASKIENCLLSILAQTHPDVEVVVVDGGSDDGTLDVLRRYSGRVNWTSEPDGGVNEAQWKGVVRATKEWVLLLGADDYLASPTALERLFQACPADLGSYDIVTGHALYEDGRLYRSNRLEYIRMKNIIHGQGGLYRRSLFAQKSYDLSFRIYYDYEFNLWALTSGKRVYNTGVLLSILGCGGLSDRPRWRNYVEDMRVRARYVRGLTLYVANLFCILRFARKSVRFYLTNGR
jgi:glycosyltransferase involved in cell wall biosynthesis